MRDSGVPRRPPFTGHAACIRSKSPTRDGVLATTREDGATCVDRRWSLEEDRPDVCDGRCCKYYSVRCEWEMGKGSKHYTKNSQTHCTSTWKPPKQRMRERLNQKPNCYSSSRHSLCVVCPSPQSSAGTGPRLFSPLAPSDAGTYHLHKQNSRERMVGVGAKTVGLMLKALTPQPQKNCPPGIV